MDVITLKAEFKDELENNILPFWKNLYDENGSYYGLVDFDLNIDKAALKGSIFNSRILWFFSSAYLLLKDESLLKYAQHAYDFFKAYLFDEEKSGVYWSVKANGEPLDKSKHSYAQAFAIYGLAKYYRASQDEEAKDYAVKLIKTLESKAHKDGAYLESFDESWHLISNEKLSENQIIASHTMNTLLHILEAYTEFYLATGDKKVKGLIETILDYFLEDIYSAENRRLEVFFDDNLESIIDLHSYGHDIEASWLLDWSARSIAETEYIDKISKLSKVLAEEVLSKAYTGSYVQNECEAGTVDATQIWWVQAEAILGFTNIYERTGDAKYLEVVSSLWENIKANFIDPRAAGEWFDSLDPQGQAIEADIVSPWKCPYHNGRMCMQMLRRLEKYE